MVNRLIRKVSNNVSITAQLAWFVVISTFILLGILVYISYTINMYTLQSIDKILSSKISNQTNLKDLQELQKSTTDFLLGLFNILLPVLGAWVGTIVAFYFGSKHLEKAHEVIEKSLTKERLSRITIKELLDKYPEAKNVISANYNDPMDKIIEKLNDPQIKNGPLLILKDDKPFGMFYKLHLVNIYEELNKIIKQQSESKEIATKEEIKAAIENGKFGLTKIIPYDLLNEAIKETEFNKLTKYIHDFITNKKWTEEGIKNYAELRYDDTLLEAQRLMRSISDHPAVRGLVIENGKVVGIIDHDMISSQIE